jgi:hypothetical protein
MSALVQVAEHLGGRLGGDVPRDPHPGQLADDAQPSAPLHGHRRPRMRPRHAPVVQGAGLEQMCEGRVDLFCGCSRSSRRARSPATDSSRRREQLQPSR